MQAFVDAVVDVRLDRVDDNRLQLLDLLTADALGVHHIANQLTHQPFTGIGQLFLDALLHCPEILEPLSAGEEQVQIEHGLGHLLDLLDRSRA